jgi:hypothetical protein
MRISKPALFTALLCGSLHASIAQSFKADSTVGIPTRYLRNVHSKLASTDAKLKRKSLAVLLAFSKHERLIRDKVSKVNPKLDQISQSLQRGLTTPMNTITGKINVQYFSYLDTLKTSLRFIERESMVDTHLRL